MIEVPDSSPLDLSGPSSVFPSTISNIFFSEASPYLKQISDQKTLGGQMWKYGLLEPERFIGVLSLRALNCSLTLTLVYAFRDINRLDVC